MTIFRSMLLCYLLLALSSLKSAYADSTISIPLSAKLSNVAKIAEQSIPISLVKEQSKQTCVEAKRACTKIPEFRGFKIYSRMECIDVTPRISCTMDQSVNRVGSISLRGLNNALSIEQRFAGKATVRGRGEIGRHIQETATADAVIAIKIKPSISPDWSINAEASHNITWLQRPTARLFNLFPVTFGGKAEDAINKAVRQFKDNDMRKELNKIQLKSHIEPIWRELQKTQEFELPGGGFAFLSFRPEKIAIKPLSFNDTDISSQISITGKFELNDEKEVKGDLLALPDMTTTAPTEGVHLSVPVNLKLETLTKIANAGLPRTLPFNNGFDGIIKINAINLEEKTNGVLSVALKISIITDQFGTIETALSLDGRLTFDPKTQSMFLEDAKAEFNGHVSAWVLNLLASQIITPEEIAHASRINFGAEIERLRSEFSQSLNRKITDDISLSGNISSISIENLNLDDGLHFDIIANGSTSVTAFEINSR